MARAGNSGERAAYGNSTLLRIVDGPDEIGRWTHDVSAPGVAALGRTPWRREHTNTVAAPPAVGPLLAGIRAVHALATRAKFVGDGGGTHRATPLVIPFGKQLAEWAVERELCRHPTNMRTRV